MFGRKKIRKNRSRAAAARRRVTRGRKVLGALRLFFTGAGFLGLSLLFVLGYDIVTQGAMFAANRVEVTGNHILSEDRVLSLAGIDRKTNIFKVNLSVARKKLLSCGWIAEAEVGRKIPDGLKVRIKEYEPSVVLDLGKKYIMSRDGAVIKEWEASDPSGLPLLTGLTYADLPLGEAPDASFSTVLSLLEVARKDSGALSLSRLSRIDVDRDLGLTLYGTGAVKTAWVGYQNFGEKYERLARLLRSITREPSDEALSIFDLESDLRVVAGPFPEVEPDKTARRS